MGQGQQQLLSSTGWRIMSSEKGDLGIKSSHSSIVQQVNTIAIFLLLLVFTSVPSICLAQFDKTFVSPSVLRVIVLIDAATYDQATKLKTGTAVVLNGRNQLMVKADLARNAAAILVLDGGADPNQHGRSTQVVYINDAMGIAVLQTSGLQRPALTVNTSKLPTSSPVKTIGFDDKPGQSVLIDPIVSDGYVTGYQGNIIHSAAFVSGGVDGPLVNDCNQVCFCQFMSFLVLVISFNIS